MPYVCYNKIKIYKIEINSQRIGMQYINVFSCSRISEISKILNSTDAKSIKESVNWEGIARTMLIHE